MFNMSLRNSDRTAKEQEYVEAILETPDTCRAASVDLDEGLPRGNAPPSSADSVVPEKKVEVMSRW